MKKQSLLPLVPLLLAAQITTAQDSPNLDEKSLAALLARPVIGPDLALAEVQVFNETRVPVMPRVRTAAEWRARAAKIRKDVLDKVAKMRENAGR